MAVLFLCTQVKQPDINDRKKLVKVMMYLLQATQALPLILKIDNSGNVLWYIDASFTVHNNMRSHTGILMTMGKGLIYSASTKQKLDNKSFTEAEVIGVNNGINQALWTKYFLETQGYFYSHVTI